MSFIRWGSGGSYSEMYGNECTPSLLEFLLCETFVVVVVFLEWGVYDELTKLSSVLDIFRA